MRNSTTIERAPQPLCLTPGPSMLPSVAMPGNTSIDATSPDPRAWLEQWPAARRSLLANIVHHAVRAGAQTPASVVAGVDRDLMRRLQWARTLEQAAFLGAVHASLTTDRPALIAYIQGVLRWEALSPGEREQHKALRAAHYQREWMAQRPMTPRQEAYLHALGYGGEPPTNAADASALIDTLTRPTPGVRETAVAHVL